MKTAFYLIFTLVFTLSLNSCATTVQKTPNRTVVLKTLPRTHKVIHNRGIKYYKFNGNHYRKTRRGYVVVRV